MNFPKSIQTLAIILKNIFLGGNIISLSLLKSPTKMSDYIGENLFLYKAMSSKRGVPEKNVFEVLSAKNIENIKLGNLEIKETWLLPNGSYTNDIVSLCLLCRIIKPKKIFEIGTMKGYTSFHFALNTPDDCKIYTLDLPQDQEVNLKLDATIADSIDINYHATVKDLYFKKTDVESKITCLYGDSATFDFTPYHKDIDLFFIDGAHSYGYVKSDTLNALKCCHPGSVIAWHDFGRVGVGGVSKWIKELSKDCDIYVIPGGSLAFMVFK